ncbi:MAG TPA: LLM class flavin-dependent oxidoreductase, partial [Methylomirabilota bacterium]|nr:LLM class flavin-dependent oxidoreductase [Methylomirabilota bacterium]
LNGRRSADEIAELAKLAEDANIRQLWLSAGARAKDHFLRLAVAAVRTSRIGLGPIAISPFDTHPGRIALELLTFNELARGRARIVLGGGGDFVAALGLQPRRRVQAVAETIDIVRALAGGGEVRYPGEMFRLEGLFSPWATTAVPPLYVGANRPRMLRMTSGKADGVMFTDMPFAYVASLVEQIRSGLAEAGRSPAPFSVSNWFVWNVQPTRGEAYELAGRQLGFRLYYIRDVASSIGVTDAEAAELERRQPEMVRAIHEGKDPWRPPRPVAERLIQTLTISGGRQDLDGCVERLLEFERAGLNEVALALHGDAGSAIKLLGERVIPVVQRDEA